MKLRDVHVHSLETSTALSSYYVPKMITPLEVIDVLNKTTINFVLVGAHGIVGWMNEPRATQDVDVVVATRHHKKAVKVLLTAFVHLEADEHPVVTRLRDRESHDVRIDVMKPNQELYRHVFKHTHTVSSHGRIYRIPSLEMALAMKFAPMISLNGADIDKYQDAHDFGRMVVSNPTIDLQKLAELGDLVYPGGGKELVEKVGQVRRGEKLNL
jgi:hypothetical protein